MANDSALEMTGPEVTKEIEERLNRPLPSIEEILPAYRSPEANPPSIVVGRFIDKNSDGLKWGFQLSSIIKWRLASIPGAAITMPPIKWRKMIEDLSSPELPKNSVGVSLRSLRLAYDRFGVDHALTGSVDVSGDVFDIHIQVHRLPEMTSLLDRRYPGNRGELIHTLPKICMDVLGAMGVELNDAQVKSISTPVASSDEFIQRMVELEAEFDNLKPEEQFDWIRLLWEEDHDCPFVVETYFYCLWSRRENLDKPIEQYLVNAALRFPGNEEVVKVVEEYLGYLGVEIDVEKASALYASIIGKEILNPQSLLLLSIYYLDYEDNPLAALRLSLQAATDYPRYFPAWSVLSHVARTCVSRIDYEIVVPATTSETEDLFDYLDRLSFESLDRAINIFPTSPSLWVMKMYLNYRHYGPSTEQLNAFKKAVECGPDTDFVYEKLFNQLKKLPEGYLTNAIEGLQAAARNIPKRNRVYRDFFKLVGNDLLENWNGTREEFEALEELNEVAEELVIQNQRLDLADLGLWMFLCSNDKKSGGTVLKDTLEAYKRIGKAPGYTVWTCAEMAVAFGYPDIAEDYLDFFQDTSRMGTLNREDHIAAFDALVEAEMGHLESAKSLLEERMRRSEDNVFSMLRYLELGIRFETDSEPKQQAIRYLIDYAPNPIEYLDMDEISKEPIDRDLYPYFYQDLLRSLAMGHLASAEGRHEDAIREYEQANLAYGYLQKQSRHCLPEALPHLVRESRRFAGLE
ncbi:MAG: hypothetical protein KC940_06550 [Candidatus Omnitrophica bacterium]|nr:hypothetical protein [Candidatus Omnitrophota bacterium]